MMKEVKNEDIAKFRVLFDVLPEIISVFKAAIGYENFNDEVQTLKHTIVEKKPKSHPNGFYSLPSLKNNKGLLLKDVFFSDTKTGLPVGTNPHRKIEGLFISDIPGSVQHPMLKEGDIDIESIPEDIRKKVKLEASVIINTITQNTNKPIVCLVLSNGRSDVASLAYTDWLKMQNLKNDSDIGAGIIPMGSKIAQRRKYKHSLDISEAPVSPQENVETEYDTQFFFMSAEGHTINLTSQGLDLLYGIYGRTIGLKEKCDLLKSNSLPSLKTLEDLPMISKAAYVRFENKLFYVNKSSKECKEKKLLDKVELFDTHLKLTDEVRTLSRKELNDIAMFTKHIHKYEPDEPNPHPLLIQGDKADKIAFGFQLFHKFEDYFKSSLRYETKDTLVEAFNSFRRSRSATALSDVKDLTQSFYIAFILKLIDLEMKCYSQLEDYVCQKISEPKFRNCGKQILTIISDLKSREKNPTYNEKLKYLERVLDTITLLSTRLDYSFLPNVADKILSIEHYEYLKTLRVVFKTRIHIEDKVLEVCRGRPLSYTGEEQDSTSEEQDSTSEEQDNASEEQDNAREKQGKAIEEQDNAIDDGSRDKCILS